MNLAIVGRALGALLLMLAVVGLLPLGLDGWLGHPTRPWLIMEAAILAVGGLLFWLGRRGRPDHMGMREGMAITSLTWILFSLLAGIGIWLAAPPATYLHGCFEAMSGFTCTGATVFGPAEDFIAIEALSPGTNLWRCLMQWMGGIGIVVMSLALLPLIAGGAGMRLYRAEVNALGTERLAPRIADTARILLRLNLGLTTAVFVALLACGVSVFDALCHAMTTVATGGFSTYDTSVDGLGSTAAVWVIAVGMFACGINFALLLQALRGRPIKLWQSTEVRVYCGFFLFGTALVALSLAFDSTIYRDHPHALIRDSAFQVSSILTSSGFGSGSSFEPMGWQNWPTLAVGVLLLLMIGGGCAGSTAGGMKIVRFVIAWKAARRELRRFAEPARISPIRLQGVTISDAAVLQVGAFIFIYVLSWALGTLALTMIGIPDGEAAVAALSALSNIGPTLGEMGDPEHFRRYGDGGLVICMTLMLLGRLEFFGLLITLSWKTWRR